MESISRFAYYKHFLHLKSGFAEAYGPETDLPRQFRHTSSMKILSADTFDGGVLIVFEDGKTALYPSEMLYAALPSLKNVIDGPGPEELEED